MKVSKILHVLSVIVGFAGIVAAIVAVVAGEGLILGLTREHTLFCAGLLILVAIWFAVSAVHHIMLEDRGEVV
jgi:1-deoxy-D-xylulose 5-phosphate reductoisomerase